jgi:hypothetical protein
VFLPILITISDDMMSTVVRQEGGSIQDPSEKTMTPWAFGVTFPCGTQLTFRSLTFAAGEDGDLRMLPPGPTLEHLALMSSLTSGDSCSGSDPCVGSYIRTAKIVRGILAVISIIRPLVGALSSSSSISTPDPDSFDDYLEIGASAWGNPRKTVGLSAWWPLMVIDRTTSSIDIPPSGD